MSLGQSSKIDAQMSKRSGHQSQIVISDDETISDVEKELEHHKAKVKEYEYKLKRLKTLKKEREEAEQVLNMRRPIELSQAKTPDIQSKKKHIITLKKRDKTEMINANNKFENIQEAKDIVCNSSSEDESSNLNFDGSRKWSKFQNWKISHDMLNKSSWQDANKGMIGTHSMFNQTYPGEKHSDLSDKEDNSGGFLEDIRVDSNEENEIDMNQTKSGNRETQKRGKNWKSKKTITTNSPIFEQYSDVSEEGQRTSEQSYDMKTPNKVKRKEASKVSYRNTKTRKLSKSMSTQEKEILRSAISKIFMEDVTEEDEEDEDQEQTEEDEVFEERRPVTSEIPLKKRNDKGNSKYNSQEQNQKSASDVVADGKKQNRASKKEAMNLRLKENIQKFTKNIRKHG